MSARAPICPPLIVSCNRFGSSAEISPVRLSATPGDLVLNDSLGTSRNIFCPSPSALPPAKPEANYASLSLLICLFGDRLLRTSA